MKVLITLFLFLQLPVAHSSVISQNPILFPWEIKRILGFYPATDSEEHKKDLDVLYSYQNTRSEEDCEEARSQGSVTLKDLFGGDKGPLTEEEVDRLAPRFYSIYAKFAANIFIAKMIYRRERPYITDEGLKPCIRYQHTSSYPSGHSAIAHLFARLLSDLYPERAYEFYLRAEEVSLSRVIGGVHYPSDIKAGKKLGKALAKRELYYRFHLE